MADASETTGAWETATVSTPSCCSKTATDLAETPSGSERDATDSGQKTVTGPAATARGRTANETSPADDALDCLTTSGKRSESEVDEAGHESWLTESGLYDPSLFLDPKIRKHGRIANGSDLRRLSRLTTSQSML